jgi:hypothetical protein
MTKPEHMERLREQDWGKLSVRLTRYAFACLRKKRWADAEDLAQEAIANAFDPKLPGWDPEVDPEVIDFLKRSVRELASIGRKRRVRADEAADVLQAHEQERGHVGTIEETFARNQRGFAIVDRIRANVGTSDPRVLALLDLLLVHVDTMAEQAVHMDCTMDEVRSVRRRLGTQVKKAEREVDAIADVAKNKEKLDA